MLVYCLREPRTTKSSFTKQITADKVSKKNYVCRGCVALRCGEFLLRCRKSLNFFYQ